MELPKYPLQLLYFIHGRIGARGFEPPNACTQAFDRFPLIFVGSVAQVAFFKCYHFYFFCWNLYVIFLKKPTNESNCGEITLAKSCKNMRPDMNKFNCREFMKCGREACSENVGGSGICRAALEEKANGLHGGQNAGRCCWVIAGTFCNEKFKVFL